MTVFSVENQDTWQKTVQTKALMSSEDHGNEPWEVLLQHPRGWRYIMFRQHALNAQGEDVTGGFRGKCWTIVISVISHFVKGLVLSLSETVRGIFVFIAMNVT